MIAITGEVYCCWGIVHTVCRCAKLAILDQAGCGIKYVSVRSCSCSMIGRKSAMTSGMSAGLGRGINSITNLSCKLHDTSTDSTNVAVLEMVNTAGVTHIAGQQPFSA